MTKLPLFLILSFLITSLCYADGTSVTYTQPPLNIQEEDGSPSTFPYILKFPNGGVTDNGDGSTSVLDAAVTLPGPVTISSDLTVSGAIFGSDDLILQPKGGNVGIGTTAPTRKLDVTGDAGISSDLTIGGNVFFDTTGGGMQIGCLSGHNVNFDTVLAAQDTWYQILAFNEAGAGRGKIISEVDEDHIKVLISGIYQIFFSMQGHSGVANDYIIGVRKNNGTEAADSIDIHLTTAVAGRIVGGSNLCYAFLDANDTIEIWIQRTDGAAVSKTWTTDHVTLNIKLIGY